MEVLKQKRAMTWLLVLLAVLIAIDIYQTGVERMAEGFNQALNLRVESNIPQMGFATLPMENMMHIRVEPLRSPGEIASPKVTLYWDPVPDAAYYRIGMAPGQVGDLLSNRVTIRYFAETEDTGVQLNLAELRWTFWEKYEDGFLISPTTLLGAVTPGSRPVVKVDAHAEDGRLLATSAIIERHSVSGVYGWRIAADTSTGLAWSDEAQAIREQRYGEALVDLQRRLAKDPYDEEALHILFRAYYFGVDRDGRYHNPELAVIYGTRLLEVLSPGAIREGYAQRVAEMAEKANIVWEAPEVGNRQEGE